MTEGLHVICMDGPWEGREIDVAANLTRIDAVHSEAGTHSTVAYRIDRDRAVAWFVKPEPPSPRRFSAWREVDNDRRAFGAVVSRFVVTVHLGRRCYRLARFQ